MVDVPRTVLVLNTGRCGSVTFARACGHLTSHTAGHETRTHLVGDERLAFPDGHIEVDNRLAWLLGRLEDAFGDRAAYVHLTRDEDDVVASFARRHGAGIMHAYHHGILMGAPARSPDLTPEDVARDLVRTVTANIESFLATKTHVMGVRLETMADDLDRFLDWIGAVGDRDAAIAEAGVRHNASPGRRNP